jgi:sugar phosphate isomerase/epimerase
MIFAGRNPIDYFKKYPNRFPMIHVKDFLPAHDHGAVPAGKAPMLGAELGHGVVDYKPIFAAAGKAGLQHYFVEQEGPFSRMTPLQAAQVDYDYLHSLG